MTSAESTVHKVARKVRRMNVFVRFKSESTPYCHWPIMQDRKSRTYYIGGIGERYPTEYSPRRLGAAVAWILRNSQVAQVEVKEAPDYDAEQGSDTGNGCPGDVGARDAY